MSNPLRIRRRRSLEEELQSLSSGISLLVEFADFLGKSEDFVSLKNEAVALTKLQVPLAPIAFKETSLAQSVREISFPFKKYCLFSSSSSSAPSFWPKESPTIVCRGTEKLHYRLLHPAMPHQLSIPQFPLPPSLVPISPSSSQLDTVSLRYCNVS